MPPAALTANHKWIGLLAFLEFVSVVKERRVMKVATTPWFVLNSPELGRPFADFYESCKRTGVLDEKTKELLMVALACVFRCRSCLEEHIKRAMEVGVTREELTEALLLAAAEGAGSQLDWQKDLYMKYLA